MAQETTNGEKPKEPNLVQVLHDQWVKAGSKPPPDAVVAKLIKAWKEASKKRDAAEEAFNAAKHEESQTVQAIILAVGKGRLRIGGKNFIPMSKGKSVWLRNESLGEVKDLGG